MTKEMRSFNQLRSGIILKGPIVSSKISYENDPYMLCSRYPFETSIDLRSRDRNKALVTSFARIRITK
jgi:hypothetical protein